MESDKAHLLEAHRTRKEANAWLRLALNFEQDGDVERVDKYLRAACRAELRALELEALK